MTLRLYVARALFVALTIVLAALDVDAAFFAGHTDPTAIVGAVAVLVGWFAAYAWLTTLVGGRRALA